ncbi:MAG: HAD family phosphatase [Clostridium sp.]
MKGVIFDLDGTLIDSSSAWLTLASGYLKFKGITPVDNVDEILKKASLEEGAEYFISNYGFELSVDEIISDVNVYMKSKYENEFNLKDGAAEYIKYLKNNGVKVSLATMTTRTLVEKVLSRHNILDLFDYINTCSEVGFSKKHPNVYLKCCTDMNLDISDVVVFEDSLPCIKVAKKAGFYVVGIKDIDKGSEELIKEISDKYIKSFKDMI